MQQSIVKFIALSYRHCSTCFRHYNTHHQELVKTAVAASGFRMNVEVEVFSAVVGLLVRLSLCWCNSASDPFPCMFCWTRLLLSSCALTNRPRLRTLPPPHSYRNQRLQRQFDGLLMMGIVMPETCWAVSVLQGNKFYDWLLHLVGCFIRIKIFTRMQR